MRTCGASSPEVAIQPVPELQKPNDQFVQSFARGLSVIRAFGPDAREMTLSEVADRTSLTRAAARRILLTLQQLGYVAATGRKFFLTPRILDLGYSYLSTTPLWDLAEPYMEELVSRVHESSSASVLDGTDIVDAWNVGRRDHVPRRARAVEHHGPDERNRRLPGPGALQRVLLGPVASSGAHNGRARLYTGGYRTSS